MFKAESILKDALKSIGVGRNTKEAQRLRAATVEFKNQPEWDKPKELIAYAMEKQMTGLLINLEDEAERLAREWLSVDTHLSLEEYLLHHASEKLKAELSETSEVD